jgi:hypothetical protein
MVWVAARHDALGEIKTFADGTGVAVHILDSGHLTAMEPNARAQAAGSALLGELNCAVER